MMHKIVSVFLLITIVQTHSLSAQTDTTYIQTTVETGVLENQRFIDRYDYLFRTQQRSRVLLKALLPESGPPTALLNLAIEAKLSAAFSLQAGYGLGAYAHFKQDEDTIIVYKSSAVQRWRGEVRYYYDMPRRMRNGLSANNMTGNYIGLETSYNNFPGTSGDPEFNPFTQATFLLRYGIQRRFFRYGFMDLSYGLGARKTWYDNKGGQNQASKWSFAASTRLNFGLALSIPNLTAQRSDYCSVWRCQRDQYRMFKIELLHALSFTDAENYKININPSYEAKIRQSPFSVVGELRSGASHYSDFATADSKRWYAQTEIQGRYYFTLKNRMERGETGNNLAGLYIGVTAHYQYEDSYLSRKSSGVFDDLAANQVGAGLRIGMQQNLFTHGYVDFYIDYRAGYRSEKGRRESQPISTNNIFSVDMNMSIRAGLAF